MVFEPLHEAVPITEMQISICIIRFIPKHFQPRDCYVVLAFQGTLAVVTYYGYHDSPLLASAETFT